MMSLVQSVFDKMIHRDIVKFELLELPTNSHPIIINLELLKQCKCHVL